MLNYFPQYFTSKAIYLYFTVLVVVGLLFSSYVMNWYWYVFGIVSVTGFFYFSNTLSRTWQKFSEKSFTQKLFFSALGLRLLWVVFSYFFYQAMTGLPFEFLGADALMYHATANDLATRGFEHYESAMWGLGLSDRGYPTYLGVVYMLTGKSIVFARIIKALLSAYTCVLIYKIANRTFNDSVARIAAIFCMLMPNLIYYCGLHLKETEMLFLTVAFIERADYAMRSAKFTFFNLLLPILLAASLFFFRTVLGATALFAFFSALIFAPGRVIKGWKRMLLVVWVLLAVGYFMGGRIATEVEEVWERRKTNQETSMQWRAERKGGNTFAQYASKSIFAPAIFIIPFSSMVDIPNQENQQLIHGGNYIKNIMAFFVMLALITAIRKGKWRDFSLLGTFVLGYLMVIAFSAFAHSERFHLPTLPFLLAMAAYGVSVSSNTTKKYYLFYLVFTFIALIAWNFIKLKGRGII